MIILQYGLKKPQTNDRGPVVFPALEENFEQLDQHDHDGVTSKKLASTSIEAVSVPVDSADWQMIDTGLFKQVVNMPAGADYDKLALQVRLSTGQVIHPSIVRLSPTQFELRVNDPSINLVVVFS